MKFVFTCPYPECGKKITHDKRGYARRKGFTHLNKVHKVQSILMDTLDSYVQEAAI